MKRTLTLRSEVLTELTSVELSAVAGGVPPTRDCPTAGICTVKMLVEKLTTFEPAGLPTEGCV